jgi:putative transposase
MKLTAAIQLLPTPQQADALRRTLETANAACNYISQLAWESQTFRQFPLHRLSYQSVRETFHLAAQLAVRCIAKVAHAYKLDRKRQRTFQPHGAVPYDDRILSYNLKGSGSRSGHSMGGRRLGLSVVDTSANCLPHSADRAIWGWSVASGICS